MPDREREGWDALTAVLSQYPDVFAPTYCRTHGTDEDACDCPPDEAIAVPGLYCTNVVIATMWQDPANPDGDWIRNGQPPSQPRPLSIGLLAHALDEYRGVI